MLHSKQSRTIIGAAIGEAPSADNRPGIAYCHNVMPTEYGVTSIAYKETVPVVPGLAINETFVDVRAAFGDEKSRIYLAWTSAGEVYVLRTGPYVSEAWYILPTTSPAVTLPLDPDTITIGNVDGISYIFYANSGGFTYSESTNSLVAVAFNGLSITDILGLTSTSGYLIAYSVDAVAWSSTIDPTDFVPSQITGAGGGKVAGIAGDIKFCTHNSLGILVYSEANVIAGNFTGNSQFPFRFKEIEDSKGGISLDLTAYQANSGTQFVFSKGGLQAIKIAKAETIFPSMTDFLTGRRFEDFNESTMQYEITDIAENATMYKKIKYIASRYLIMSYGVAGFTHAIVLDTSLQRLGKLKIDHTDVFEYVNLQSEVARENIAFLKSDGSVSIVDFAVTNENSSGLLVLAKLEQSRGRFIALQEIEVETIESDAAISVYDQVSLDGKNFTTVQATLDESTPGYRLYKLRAEGKNHGVVLKGKFDATTVQVTYIQSSRR